MGLDMYLYLEKYESKFEDDEDFYPSEFAKLRKDVAKRNFLSKVTSYQVGYWRQARAIHKWFVSQTDVVLFNGDKIYISIEQLEDLLDRCNKILSNHDMAKELLPLYVPAHGGVEFDEHYFYELQYTKELLEEVIEIAKKGDYEICYGADW